MFISVSSYLLCLLILSAAGLRSLSSSVLVFAVSWIVVSLCFVKSPLLLHEEFFVCFHILMYFGFSWSGWLGCFMLWSHLLCSLECFHCILCFCLIGRAGLLLCCEYLCMFRLELFNAFGWCFCTNSSTKKKVLLTFLDCVNGSFMLCIFGLKIALGIEMEI